MSNSKALDFAQSIRDGSIQLKDGQTMLQGYQSYLKSTGQAAQLASIKTKALSASMKVLSTIGWMAIFTVATSAISKGVEKLTEYANASENAKKKSEEFTQSVQSFTQNISSNSSTLTDLNSEYQELSKGVNTLGENVGLSADRYDRYKQVISQISGIMPNLTAYFNDQGEKIAFVKGNLEDLNLEYQKYIQQQAKEFLVNGDENGNKFQDTLDNFSNNKKYGAVENLKNAFKNMFSYDIDDLPVETMIKSFEDIQNKSREEIVSYLSDIDLGVDGTYLQTDKNRSKMILQDILGCTTGDILNATDEEFNVIQEKISSNLQSLQNDIDVDMSSITTGLVNSAYAKDDFWALDKEDLRNDVTTILSSITGDVWGGLGIETEDDVQSFVNSIISAVSTNKDGFRDAWDGLFELDPNEMPTEEYITKVQAFTDTLCSTLGIENSETKKQFMISLGFDIDTSQAMIDGVKSKIDESLNGNKPMVTAGVTLAIDNQVKSQTQQELDDWIDSLNAEDLQLVAEGKIVFDENLTAESAQSALDVLKSGSVEDIVLTYESLSNSAEIASDSFSTLHSSISSINDAFAEQSDNGSISVDMMLSLVDAGYAAALQFDAATGACTLNKDAMLDLVQAKIQNQIADLQTLQTDIATKLREDGLIASESATGFINLAKAKAAAATAEQLSSVDEYNNAGAQIKALENSIKNIDKIGTGKYSTSKKSSSGSKASKSSTDPIKEQFQAEYDLLKHNLEMEYISEEQYYNAVDALNQKYFAGKEKYLDEYQKYEEEVYKGLKGYYKTYIEDQIDFMDKALDANKISYQHYSSKVSSMLSDMYKSGKISAEDYFSYTQKMMEKQLSIYQSALNGVITLLDNEIDKWEDKIDAIEKQNDALEKQIDNYDGILSEVDDVYQKEIDRLKEEQDNIQSKIDSLNDEADAYDLIRRKEEALYALRRAEEQRTKKVFIEGQGFIYKQDTDAIRDAQDNLNDIKREELVSQLEKEKDALNDSIDLLEKYRELWSEITNAKETETNRQLAIALWGQNYEQFILQNRTSDIEAFKENYLQAQAQIDDNTSLIESYEQKVEYYNQLKEQWQSITDAYQNAVDAQNAAQLLGANWETEVLSGRLDTLNTFRNEYIALQQAIADAAWNSANAQIQALNAVKTAQASASATSNTGSAGSVGTTGTAGTTTASSLKKSDLGSADWYDPITGKKGSGTPPRTNHNIMTRYGTGTDNAKPGIHEVAESGDEIIIDNHGNALLAEGHQLHHFEGGEIVKDASETREFLNNANSLSPINLLGNIDVEKFLKNTPTINPTDFLNVKMPDYSFLDKLSINSNSEPININIGDIKVEGVQNTDTFAEAVLKEFPNKMLQAMHRRH